MLNMITAVLFVLLQASSPVPRQAAHGQRPKADSDKQDSVPNKPPPAPVAIYDPVAPGNAKGLSQTKTDKQEQQNVSISVLPKVSVQKDAWDYAYIGASLLIALVTLGIAWITLIQARAAKANAEAAIISAKAARDTLYLTQAADIHIEGIDTFPKGTRQEPSAEAN
jgi:hypothetical protein